MSYMLPHLHNGWQVDQAILSEEDRVVVIRFGHDWDPTCMKMDEVLYSIAEKERRSETGVVALQALGTVLICHLPWRYKHQVMSRSCWPQRTARMLET
uniref:Thioredoxin like 4A n=1 Tax=Equus caballus TaxID=9796 RepID=F7B0J6_HORSE